MSLDRRSFPLWAAAGLAGVAGLAVLHLWVPAPGVGRTVCLLRLLTGVPCPGCGMTRALAHLAKGEWAAAAADHALAFPLAAELLLGWLAWGAALLGRRPLRVPAGWTATLFIGHLAVLTAFWLGRAASGTLPW